MGLREIDVGLVVCIGGFLGGITASTLWILQTTGPLKLLGLVLILVGIGSCSVVISDESPANESDFWDER